MPKALPEAVRLFAEKEARWAEAGAKADYLLKLPQPNHRYVDVKGRWLFDDLRFTVAGPSAASGKGKKGKNGKKMVTKDPDDVLTAGVPSERPHAPYGPPYLQTARPLSSSLLFEIPIFGSPEDYGTHGITNNAF